MDIEGFEGKAIKGSLNLIKKNKDIKLILEFFPFAMKECDVDAKELLNTLRKQGFDVEEIEEKKQGVFPIKDSILLGVKHFKIHNATNLLFKRK